MKQKAWILAVAICVVLLPIAFEDAQASLTFVVPDKAQEETAEPAETVEQTQSAAGEDTAPIGQTSTGWDYPISKELLEDPLDVIRLVNKDNMLDSDYPPKKDDRYTLVDAEVKKTKGDEMLVREVAHEPLIRMFDDAAAEGIQLRLHSAYRSHYRQAVMHENRLKDIGKDDGVVQQPGASDHQTGLGVDIINPAWIDEPRMTERFAETEEAKWMEAHCAEYGFIIRYPKGKTDITGIIYEPWHLRYVGVEVATYIMEKGITLEEFTAEWNFAMIQSTIDAMADDGVEAVEDSFSF